ncbi:MAG: hypothetical protein ACLFMO_07750 [Eubacteriales bacterium]
MGKKVAPIIITIIMVSFTSLYLFGLIFSLEFAKDPISYFFMILGAFIVIGFIIALIYTLNQRLKEIDKEDDDDLSKY